VGSPTIDADLSRFAPTPSSGWSQPCGAGKGVCHAGECDFLIAVAVKSFDTGDSNRDLHMQQVTKAGQFPLVTVRTQLPETLSGAATISADLEIEFAGQKVQYKQVPFQQVTEGIRSGSRERFQRRSPISKSTRRRYSPLRSKTIYRCTWK